VPVESSYNYIDDLNPSWPNDDPDQVAQSAEHHRGQKNAIKGSFPNLGQAAFTGTAAELNKVAGAAGAIINLIYPVGAIYCSAGSTDPSTLFGVGTWVALSDKQTLVQQGTYTAGSTGGSSTAIAVLHSHTLGNDGNHNHNVSLTGNASNTVDGQKIQGTSGFSTARTSTDLTTTDGNHNHTVSVEGASGTDANMPPYLAVYMWQRTA